MQIDRLSFSESAISGTIDWKFDTDDNTTVSNALFLLFLEIIFNF